MTWEIFLGIVAIVGFIITVCGPLMKLNGNIVRLNDSLDTLQKAIDKVDQENEKSHKRIWDHEDEQDQTIKNHEGRLNYIEHKWEIAEALNPHLMNGGLEDSRKS